MDYLRLLGIAVLFVLVGLGTVGGCGSSGSGGGEVGNGDGDELVEGKNIVSAEITFAASISGRFALDNLSFNPVITFDEPEFSPPEPINGKTVQVLREQIKQQYLIILDNPL